MSYFNHDNDYVPEEHYGEIKVLFDLTTDQIREISTDENSPKDIKCFSLMNCEYRENINESIANQINEIFERCNLSQMGNVAGDIDNILKNYSPKSFECFNRIQIDLKKEPPEFELKTSFYDINELMNLPYLDERFDLEKEWQPKATITIPLFISEAYHVQKVVDEFLELHNEPTVEMLQKEYFEQNKNEIDEHGDR